MSWRRGPTAILTQVLLTIAALFHLILAGVAQPWVTEGPKPCLPLALTSVSCLQLTRTTPGTWLYYCLTFTCFRCSSAYLHRYISWLTAPLRINIWHLFLWFAFVRNELWIWVFEWWVFWKCFGLYHCYVFSSSCFSLVFCEVFEDVCLRFSEDFPNSPPDCVGLGRDQLVDLVWPTFLLCFLNELSRFYPEDFEVVEICSGGLLIEFM